MDTGETTENKKVPKKLISERLKENGYTILNPTETQGAGILLTAILFFVFVIIFENKIAVVITDPVWLWVARIPYYIIMVIICIALYLTSLSDIVPPGSRGVFRFLGKPVKKLVYDPGVHFQLLGKGNKMLVVSMEPQRTTFEASVTSLDGIEMATDGDLMYEVYDIDIYLEAGDFQKVLNTLVVQSFFTLGREHLTEAFLGLKSDTILESITKHIDQLPGEGFKLEDFGVEIKKDTIAAKPFRFANPKSREAFESLGREKKEQLQQESEIDHFTNLANKIVEASELKGPPFISFNDAFLIIHQQYGENPQEVKRIIFDSPTIEKIIGEFFLKNK